MCLAIFLSGCGMPNFPSNPNANISVTQKDHEIRLTPIIDGKPIEIKLDISALSNGATVGGRCECGCGKAGCACDNQMTQEPVMSSQPIVPRKEPVGAFVYPRQVQLQTPVVTPQVIEILTVEGCYACTLALNDLKAAGYDARLVYGVQAPSYPTLRINGKTWVTGGWNSDGSSLRETRRQFNLK